MVEFAGHCVNCGATLPVDGRACAYCGTSFRREDRPFAWRLLEERTFRSRRLYPLLIAAGASLAALVYGVLFDSLSERTLIGLTPLWFCPISFGTYGYLADRLLAHMAAGGARTMPEAYSQWLTGGGRRPLPAVIVLAVLFFPFRFLDSRNSVLVAGAGALTWGAGLWVFFSVVFPAL